MRRAFALTAVTLCLAGCGGSGDARPAGRSSPARTAEVATARVDERIVDLSVASRAVGRKVPVRLLLPAGYDAEPDRRWPVLYLLHGCCDSYQSWTRSTDVERLSRGDDVLVVMPDGDPVGFYSDWLRGPAWERFHLGELRRLLEERYRAGRSRAIAGLSMGGFGALSYAARNRGMFRAAASYSGILDPQRSEADERFVLGLVGSQGEAPRALWGDPVRQRARWSAHNPAALAGRLRGLDLFVSSGNGQPGPLEPAETPPDQIEPVILRQTRSFLAALRARRIPVRADLYGDGLHDWPYWQRELHRSWPMLMRAIGADRRGG